MKKSLLTLSLALTALCHAPAHAADSTQSFNVTINLTPACALGTVSGISFTYTGAQTGSASGSGGNFSLLCTANLPYTFALDNDGGSATGTATSRLYVDQFTQLQYNLVTPAAGTGTGSSQALALTSSIAGNQAGSCPSASACDNSTSTNKTRTLIVSY